MEVVQIPLVGIGLEALNQEKLPTSREVLQLYFFFVNINKNKQEAANSAVAAIISLWRKTGLPFHEKTDVKNRLNKLVNLHSSLMKNSKYNGTSQVRKRNEFEISINNLFDISITRRLNHETIRAEKLHFLNDQRNNRELLISSIENNAEIIEEITSEDEFVPNDTSDNNDIDPDFEPPRRKKKRSRNNLNDESERDKSLCSVLDRVKASHRGAAFILNTVAKQIAPEKKFSFSKSSLHRHRAQNRESVEQKANSEIFECEEKILLHVDTKKIKSKTGRKALTERLAIVARIKDKEVLLGIPTISDGTAKTTADAIFEVINQYDLKDKVIGLCFDNAPVNTGLENGVCALLEKVEYLNKKLLWLPCRHHIFEIVCGAVFNEVLNLPETGPNIPFFQDFQDEWEDIKDMPHSPCADDRLFTNDLIKELKEETVQFIYNLLENDRGLIYRDDYLELLELTLLFLGEVPPDGVSFRILGCYSNARWMNKAIYILKIFLFREFFFLSDDELNGCLEFCLFLTLIYVKHWFTCTIASDSAFNDLKFITQLQSYNTISENVAEAAMTAFTRHLSYLGEELVVSSLFSNNVPDDVKSEIQTKLLEMGPASFIRNRNSLKYTDQDLDEKYLDDFVGRRSFFLFSVLDIETTFLDYPVEMWNDLDSYKTGKEIIKDLPVVNDSAERAIKLAVEFNDAVTNDEMDKQRLFRTVFRNRKVLPNCNKKTIYAT